MELFWKTTASVLISAILCQLISTRAKEMSVILCLAACCMAAAIALEYLDPVLEFFMRLEEIGAFQKNSLEILLKIVAIGLVTQIATSICNESGCSSLGRSLHILSTSVILYLSIPLFSALVEVLQDILGGI